jgi:hypothetical protein
MPVSRPGASLFGTAVAVAIAAAPIPARADEAPACIAAHAEGQRERHAGHLSSARDRFVACARDACPELVQKDCAVFLAEVVASMPTMVVEVEEAGRAITEGHLRVDDVERPLDGRAIELDPGRHTLRFTAKDGREATVVAIAREGEKNQRALVELAPAPAPPRPTAVLAPVRPADRPVPALVWVSGGAGVVALGASVAFGAAALAETSCKPKCTGSEIDAVHRYATTSDVTLVAGVALVGVAIVLYATRSAAPAPIARGLAVTF